jgi:hypothetical protein
MRERQTQETDEKGQVEGGGVGGGERNRTYINVLFRQKSRH